MRAFESMAYWGPACYFEDGKLSETTKKNLVQYKDAGFTLYTLTPINAIASDVDSPSPFLDGSLKTIMDFLSTIGLKILVRDETIQRLSNVKRPLVKNGQKALPLLIQDETGGWNFVDDESIVDEQNLKYQAKEGDSAKEIKEIVHQFQSQSDLNETILKMMKPYATHHSFAGLDLWDEPDGKTFQALGELMEAIAFVDEGLGIKTLATQCLLPSYGFTSHTLFEQYLDAYCAVARGHSSMVALRNDVYPLRKVPGSNTVPVMMRDYPLSLKILSTKAAESHLAFELCLQCFGNTDNLRDPSPNELLFQVGVALSFGASNISFYPYSHDTHGPTYTSAIVEGEGEKGYREGKLYKTVQQINKDLPSSFSFLEGFRLAHSSLFAKEGGKDYDAFRDSSLSFEVKSNEGPILVNELSNGKEIMFGISNLSSQKSNSILFSIPFKNISLFAMFGKLTDSIDGPGTIKLSLKPGETVFMKERK